MAVKLPNYFDGSVSILNHDGDIPEKAPTIHVLFWTPPPVGWIKANSDGVSKGNPGLAACGGVFRDPNGLFLGAFARSLGWQTAYYAEIMAVILVIEKAFERGWLNLWLETDSMLLVNLLANPSLEPPNLVRSSWLNCRKIIASMNFRFSHTFRENNGVADLFANKGLYFSELIWWDAPPNCALELLWHDGHGLPKYRLSKT